MTTFGKIKINYLFKDGTIEMLENKEFQKAVAKAFPLEPWVKPFNDFDAAKAIIATIGNID